MNASLLIDFYKAGHVYQYPKGISKIYCNWTARKSRIAGINKTVHFGLQYFIKHVLEEMFTDFVCTPKSDILLEYQEVMRDCLGIDKGAEHIGALWDFMDRRGGEMPIKLYSLPEGSIVPIGVPAVVIVNTDPRFFWLPNFLETVFSNSTWMASTSATIAKKYREICERYAQTDDEKAFINWQCHDFSYRGMSGLEAAQLSGMGHLTQFSGTDTVPAIMAARQYYDADLTCGGSVPATEHSVMCAGSKDGELETFKRLITEVYPSGIVSIVSDTWDLWKVLTEYIPQLKDQVLARNGKIVIRPDSGDPVEIICGHPHRLAAAMKWADNVPIDVSPEDYGAMKLLAKAMGVTNGVINKAGLIYGDSITPDRCDEILRGITEAGFSTQNMVFGVGSYTYQYQTRDTFGYAMKATAIERDGAIEPIFKSPITDDGTKKSLRGIPIVHGKNGSFTVTESTNPADLGRCAYEVVYDQGSIVDYSFDDIRERSRQCILSN